MNDNISFGVLEMNDITDKLNLNLSLVRGQLSGIKLLLDGLVDHEADTALALAFATDHFVDLLQNDLNALTNAVSEKKNA